MVVTDLLSKESKITTKHKEAKVKQFISVEPFHPGEFIKDEMEARGWSHEDMSTILGISRRQLINLIQGKSGVSPDMAVALAKAFEQEAETWMHLQVAIFDSIPLREVQRRGWVKKTSDLDELEQSVCEFLNITEIGNKPEICLAARRNDTSKDSLSAQAAWYCRSRQLAEYAPAAKYKDGNIDSGIEKLCSLAAYPEEAHKVPKVIADMGIKLVFVEKISKSKIDGAAFWLDSTTPVISLSLRYDRIDNFWFTLLHELVHINNKDEAPIDIDIMSKESVSKMEINANTKASNYLIQEEKLDSFILRNRPLYYRKKVVQFAQLHGVHPGIVVGQLQYRGEIDYQQLRKELAKIRSYIVGNAITDGWGNNPK